MPEKVHDCVKSVLDDNPEMEESRAWAICQAEMQADAGEIEVNTLDDLTGIQAADMNDLVAESDWAGADGVWWHEDEQLVVYDPSAIPGADQQAGEFAADIFRIVQSEDSEMDLDGDVMGVGVNFPNAGVYVDWRIDAWPDDEQLKEPHVSDYGSVDDLEQATGGTVEHLETVEAVASEETDQQAVTVSSLSQEAITDIKRRYNADVTVVDGEDPAAPTDTAAEAE
jgi:hypothetical protein